MEKGENRKDTLQGGKLGVGTFFNSFVKVKKKNKDDYREYWDDIVTKFYPKTLHHK